MADLTTPVTGEGDQPNDRSDPGASQADLLDSHEAGGVLLRGSSVRLAGFVATVALSVLSAALLIRHLGIYRFGQYTTVLSLIAVVAAVTDAGMSTLGTREYAIRRGADRDRFMQALLGLRVALTLVGVLLMVGFAIAVGYDAALLLGAVAASLATVPLVVQHTLSIPLSTDLRLGTLSALELARQFLLLAGLIALVLLGAGVLPLLAVPLVANTLLVTPTAALADGRVSGRPRLSPTQWPALLQTTLVFSLATAVGTIYVYAAQILTSLITDHYQSGLFAVSFRVFIVAGAVPGLLVGAALPLLSRAARDDSERLAYGLIRIFDTTLLCGVGAALGVSTGAGFIVAIVAGPHYSQAVPVLEIQAWGLVASFVLAGASFGLLALHEHRPLLLSNLLALIVSVPLTLVLADHDGAQGAAIATVVGESSLALCSLIALARVQPECWPRPKIVIKVFVAAAVAAIFGYLPSVPSLPRAVFAVGAYTVLAFAIGAVPGEIRELLPSRRRAT